MMDHGLQSLLLLLLLTLSTPPPFSEAKNQKYLDCAPTGYSCGGHTYTISFPFRFGDRPDYCGHPDFTLTCTGGSNSMLMINLGGGKQYEVSDIDYINQLLHVTDPSFSGQSCPLSFTNTTLDFSLFDYTDRDLNLSFYFNCPSVSPSSANLSAVNCTGSNSSRRSYYSLTEESPSLLPLELDCGSVTLIPMYQSTANLLVSGANDFVRALQEGFGVTWLAGREWCSDCTSSGGICGYNADSPDAPSCFCPNSTSTTLISTCPSTGDAGNGSKKNRKIIIGSITGIFGILLACVLFLYMCWTKRFHNSVIPWRQNNDQNIEAFLEKYGSLAPKRYSYSDAKKITNSFHFEVGQGGYGIVYKGTLEDGRPVAVKLLSDSKSNGEDFVNEVASISRTSHVNVVSLLGFCSEGSKRALIYEYMCNGSLEKVIYSEKPKAALEWEKLYQIAIGIARGLEYLHRGCNTRIVHFDIKPHNILLDEDLCPKITDFGLAKLCPRKDSILSMAGARGTIGYIAPEVFSRNFGVVSSKSDIYSYGMMILEMVGGRNNFDAGAENSSEIYFPHWIYEHLDKNDLRDCGVTNENEEIARKMILVGLWCIQTMPQNRPSTGKVIEMLEGTIKDIETPPKPYLSSP